MMHKIQEATSYIARTADGRTLCVMMSGGSDSTLTAALALRAGCRVVGAVMELPGSDCAVQARIAARALGIDLIEIDLKREFTETIERPFVESYTRGTTPNPCVMCNARIKLGLFIDMVRARIDEDMMFATGHYARVDGANGEVVLRTGVDARKDQSYFLCMVPSERIASLVLTLGIFTKNETRAALRTIADGDAVLERIASSPESMEVCFLADGDYRDELRDAPGSIVSPDGEVLGAHSGIGRYTVGQRKGLGIASNEPLYVVGMDAGTNTVIAAPREFALRRTIRAASLNVIAPKHIRDGAAMLGKIRSQQAASPCVVHIDGSCATAVFDSPVFAPAPGQYLALYDGDILAAGAEIIGSE